MNSNETLKTSGRLNRIQNVSKGIRFFLRFGIPLIVIALLMTNYLAVTQKINLPIPPRSSGPELGADSFKVWGILSLVLYLFWYRTALKLFAFFEKGILFTAETVRCIQILGSIYFAKFLVQLGLYFLGILPVNQWLGNGLSNLFTGLFIVFIGWLIDEARKIREEQELTV